MIDYIKKNINPKSVMVIIAVVNIISVLIALISTKGAFLSEVIWDARNGLFLDFDAHLFRLNDGQPYDINDWDARFPALAYAFYFFMRRIIPEQIVDSTVTEWYVLFDIIVLCICVWLVTWVIGRWFEGRGRDSFIIGCFFFLSQPFALAEVKAANSALYVLVLVLLALYLRDRDSKVCKEIALILIALAAGFKITPAIWGFLYLKEKRYKETVRLIIYGVLFFFSPFWLFGGVSAIKDYLTILSSVSEATIPRPETIIGVCNEVFAVLGQDASVGAMVGKIMAYGYAAVCLLLFMLTKKDWKSMFLMSSLMVIVVNMSYPYTLQYLIIPIIFYWIQDGERKYRAIEYVELTILGLVFTTYPFVRIDWPTATFLTNYFWLYILVFIILVDKIYEICLVRKNNDDKS